MDADKWKWCINFKPFSYQFVLRGGLYFLEPVHIPCPVVPGRFLPALEHTHTYIYLARAPVCLPPYKYSRSERERKKRVEVIVVAPGKWGRGGCSDRVHCVFAALANKET